MKLQINYNIKALNYPFPKQPTAFIIDPLKWSYIRLKLDESNINVGVK